MGGTARPVYDPGNDGPVERRCLRQTARRGGLTSPASPAGRSRATPRSYTTTGDTILAASGSPYEQQMIRLLGSRPSNQPGRQTETMKDLRLRGGRFRTNCLLALPQTICWI